MKALLITVLSVCVWCSAVVSPMLAADTQSATDSAEAEDHHSFVGQVQEILDTQNKEQSPKEGPQKADTRFAKVGDICNNIREAVRNNQIDKAKTMAEEINQIVDQFETHKYKWSGGADVALRLAGNQINHTASWLGTFSQHAKANDPDHEIAASLYQSAYKLKLKVGPFDLFTLIYLNQFCKFLEDNGRSAEGKALWKQGGQQLGVTKFASEKERDHAQHFYDSVTAKSEHKHPAH
jgi:hypothetical protein